MERLEDVVRVDEPIDDLVLLLRGGEDTVDKLLRQAAILESRFTYGGQPARGISVFAAHSPTEEIAVLESKLRTYSKYRRVEGSRLAELTLLLPTFQSPHWTVLLQAPESAPRPERDLIDALLDILGPVLDNPRYVRERARRR